MFKTTIHHVFELVLSRMQGLSNTLRQQDLMSQSLLPKRHGTAGDDHHLPALILQHGYLTGQTKTKIFKLFTCRAFTCSYLLNHDYVVLPALLLKPAGPVLDRTHLRVLLQHSRASLQCVWPVSTHCDGQKTSHGGVGGRLQRTT